LKNGLNNTALLWQLFVSKFVDIEP